jgi:hypothetical protein
VLDSGRTIATANRFAETISCSGFVRDSPFVNKTIPKNTAFGWAGLRKDRGAMIASLVWLSTIELIEISQCQCTRTMLPPILKLSASNLNESAAQTV